MLYEYPPFPKLPSELVQEVYDWFNLHKDELAPIEGFEQFKMLPRASTHIEKEHPLTADLENNIGIPTWQANEIFKGEVCYFSIMPVPKSVHQWIADNTGLENFHASIQRFTQGSFFIPHRDLLRDVAYNYILETGGDNVRTCFYEPRDEYKHLNVTSRTFIPYERIQEIDSVVFEPEQWHKLDVSKIHSVEGLDPTKVRFSVSISIFN